MEPAPTNYTSIHIVVWCRGKYRQEYRNVPVEIQIRTALEDVWGEIDHSLKYTTKKTEDHPLRDEKRVDNIFAHLNVMKTLIDGVAQYADQIKIQLDELYKARIDALASRPAVDSPELLKPLGDLPVRVRALVAEAVESEKTALDPPSDATTQIQALHLARDRLTEARSAVNGADMFAETQEIARYAVEMELAFTLYEIGRRVEGAANLWAEAAKIYRVFEDKYPDRALIKYRHATVLDALGDRFSAMAKFRTVGKLIAEGRSDLPDRHWIRSAWARYLATLIWEEAVDLTAKAGSSAAAAAAAHPELAGGGAAKARQLEMYLEAFRLTKQVHGLKVEEATPGWPTPKTSEVAKVANNLLYFALEYLEAGGSQEHLIGAGFQPADIETWLSEIGVREPATAEQIMDHKIADTAARAFRYLNKKKEAKAMAIRVKELLPHPQTERELHMVRAAQAAIEWAE